ncbi:MAG: hypothetical protein R3F43_11915 [bacterium]
MMVAGRGDDVLLGGGGTDALSGGAGDDVLAVGDATFRRVDGGARGHPPQRRRPHLDLTALRARVRGIEIVDLAAAGADLCASMAPPSAATTVGS